MNVSNFTAQILPVIYKAMRRQRVEGGGVSESVVYPVSLDAGYEYNAQTPHGRTPSPWNSVDKQCSLPTILVSPPHLSIGKR